MRSVRTSRRAAFEVDERPVHGHFREPRQRPQSDLFDARLRRSGERNGVRCVSDEDAGNIGQPLHIALVSNPLYASIDFVDTRVLERVSTTQCLTI